MNSPQDFFKKGAKEFFKSMREFDKNEKEVSKRIDKARLEMEEWSRNTKIIRKKDSQNK